MTVAIQNDDAMHGLRGLHVIPGTILTDGFGYAREVDRIADRIADDGTIWRRAYFTGPARASTEFDVLDPLPAWAVLVTMHRDEWADAMVAHALTDVEAAPVCSDCRRYAPLRAPDCDRWLFLVPDRVGDDGLCADCLRDHETWCRECATIAHEEG